MMRRILVDHAKTKYRKKRGGKEENLPLEAALTVKTDEQDIDFIALDEALTRLAVNETTNFALKQASNFQRAS